MTSRESGPPRWAETVLRWVVRPADREAIAGDLLEEYRAAREPATGRLRADAWYLRQVLSLLWRLLWPGAIILAALQVLLAVTVFRPGHHALHQAPMPPLEAVVWYGSLVGAPGISLLDGVIYFVLAWRGARRTGLAETGILVSAAASVVGFIVLFTAATLVTPSLALAALTRPVLLLIVLVYLAVPVIFAVSVGALGGVIGRRARSRTDRLVRSS